MNEELKPCPFCGGIPQIVAYKPHLFRPSHNHPFHVICSECDLLFGYDIDYGGEFDTEEQARATWNRRVQS